MNPFQPPPRREYLDRKKKEGLGLIGVFPGRYPREVFWALGALPVEIWDPPLALSASGAHLQPTICSVVKSGLELILQGQCSVLDGFLFPHTCDSLQNLGSLVSDYLDVGKPCLEFYPPKTSDGTEARVFFRREVERLFHALEPLYGPVRPDAFRHWVARSAELSRALASLYTLRAQGRLNASNVEFYRLVRALEFMDPDDLLPLLTAFVNEREVPAPLGSPAIVLSGVLPGPWGLLSLLDDLGVRVADDDLIACGRRLPGIAAPEQEPMDAVTESYAGMPPCSTINAPLKERKSRLWDQVQKTGARGVLFNIVKFCEPELFAYPVLRESLKKRGVATLLVEQDGNREIPGQAATRLEAFVEMIRQDFREGGSR